MDFHSFIVSAVVFAPLLGALILAFIPATEKGQLKVATLLAMLATFALAIWMYFAFNPSGPEFQLQLRYSWIAGLGVSYHVGVDGVAVTLMLLTGFLGPVAALSAWNSAGERVKEFGLALLILQCAMLGSFAAMDVILFFVFWEGVLIPMYLLIGVFGHENREYASIKFFIFTMTGSMLMFVALLYVYLHTAGHHSFDYGPMLAAAESLSPTEQIWLFVAFASAFAIKVPMWPLHTWLPDAHTEAPVAGSIILAGVMLKMGTFGFMRYAMPMFPQAVGYAAPWLGIMAVIGIIYGSLMCLAQRDMKRLVAYSSVAHLGFVMLGLAALNAQASTGAVYQMVNHGVSTGALFLLIGIIYERRHTRLMSEYGGLAKATPIIAVAFVIITMSSIGLPGTNGFVGEFLILSGTFTHGLILPHSMFAHLTLGWVWLAIIGAIGVILSAAYLLTLVHKVFFGPMRNPRNRGVADLNLREAFAVVPLVLVAVGMGIFPQPFLKRIIPATQIFIQRAEGQRVAINEPQEPASRPAPVIPQLHVVYPAGPRVAPTRGPAHAPRPIFIPKGRLNIFRPVKGRTGRR